MISCVAAELATIINVYYAGKLGNPEQLAGVGLGNSWFNVISLTVFMGANGA